MQTSTPHFQKVMHSWQISVCGRGSELQSVFGEHMDGRKHLRLNRLTGLMISTSSPDRSPSQRPAELTGNVSQQGREGKGRGALCLQKSGFFLQIHSMQALARVYWTGSPKVLNYISRVQIQPPLTEISISTIETESPTVMKEISLEHFDYDRQVCNILFQVCSK